MSANCLLWVRVVLTDWQRLSVRREEGEPLSKKSDAVRALLVIVPVLAVGLYSVIRGAFWGPSVEAIPVILGVVCIVCAGGMTRAWVRQARRT